MTFSVYLPILVSLLLAAVSRPLGDRLSPRTAAPALVIASGLSAAASTWGLLLVAATLLHEASPVSDQVGEPVPGAVAAAALAALAVGVYRLVLSIQSRSSTHRALRALCDRNAADELVVVAASEPRAFAVPGRRDWPGRVLVTTGMLAALAPDERRVLLAHERAHLRGGHDWQQAVVDAAAALNPLLQPARDTVAFLLERCADEAAADAVGSRPLAARSLARAALASAAAEQEASLAFQRLAVTTRVTALYAAPPPHRRIFATGIVLLGVGTMVAAADATVSFVALVERLLPNWF